MQTYIGLHALLCYTNLLRKTSIYHTFTFCFISTHCDLLNGFDCDLQEEKKINVSNAFSNIPQHFTTRKIRDPLITNRISICLLTTYRLLSLYLNPLFYQPWLKYRFPSSLRASVLSIRPKYSIILQASTKPLAPEPVFYLDWLLRLLPSTRTHVTSPPHLEHPVILLFSSYVQRVL